MASPLKEVVDVLELLGELEWAQSMGNHASDGPPRPPFVAWRFKAPDPETERKIVDAVRSYSGAARWAIRKPTRNWTITPALVDEFTPSCRDRMEAIRIFAEHFPRETQVIRDDAPRLADHLRKVLLKP